MYEIFSSTAENKKRGFPPFASDRQRFEITVPLQNSFRFVHEPIGTEHTSRFVGRANEMESLVERILFSNGGSFLVTGYRGVGKTSFINQVVRRLADALPWAEEFLGRTEIIDIYMNVARPLQPSEIMHHIIRRMYERLSEKNVYEMLSPELQKSIETAYNRTSLNMARKLSESKEYTIGGNEINLGGFLLKAGVKIPWGRKFSRTNNYETSYLGYDDKSAEHDIISISKKLARGYQTPFSFWRRLKSFVTAEESEIIGLKIIFVFDELDKLEEHTVQIGNETRPAIEEILGTLKNLFTTSGVTFIFVAGKDLQERWLEDVGKGDSVYESVFSYDKYLPCLWTEGDSVCGSLIENFATLTSFQSQIVREFQKYLTYKGRGIPRRIVRTFNEYVKWNEEKPVAAFTPQNIRTIRFFASLQDLITANEKLLFGSAHEDMAGTGSDKQRLGVYYIFDWIFRQEKSQFTATDVLLASQKLSRKIALAEEVAPKLIKKILSILKSADYIEEIPRTLVFVPSAANQPPPPGGVDGEDLYRISPRRLGEIAGIAADVQIPEINVSDADSRSESSEQETPTNEISLSIIGKYRIIKKIGSGGMGTVYEATDFVGRSVALKLSNDNFHSYIRERFQREADVMSNLDHPNIVKFYEFGETGKRVYIAMELLNGITLERILDAKNRLDIHEAIIIGQVIARAYDYVHRQGYGRNDIKPSNIMLTDEGRVCILDFGISKRLSDDSQQTGGFKTVNTEVIGTPIFMAPEVFENSSRVDLRSDIYSFGMVLYKMLTGELPITQSNLLEIIRAKMENQINKPSSLVSEIPPVFDDIVMRCLSLAPEDRFQSMNGIAEALSQIKLHGAGSPNLALVVKEARFEIKQAEKAEQMQTFLDVFAEQAPDSEKQSDLVSNSELTAPAPPGAGNFLANDENEGESITQSENSFYSPETPDNLPFLVIVRGDELQIGRIHAVEKKLTLGRSHTNDIVLGDPAASRYHAVLEPDIEKQKCSIEDLNSAMGTFVNGERILSRYYLSNQDTIRIGSTEFVFRKPTSF